MGRVRHPNWIIGAGDMSGRVRAFDWATTPLGPLEYWSQSLRCAVNILLSSRYAMWMCWGPELTFLFNDAYLPTLGIKQSWALGSPAGKVWAEIWPDISPRIDTVFTTGDATFDQGLLLFLERSGFPEETYHTFSYSPLTDDDGGITGLLCVVTEETERLIGERRVETLRDLATGLATASTEREVLEVLHRQLDRNTLDLPFTLVYLFETDGTAKLGVSSGIELPDPLAPERLETGAESPWPAAQVFAGVKRHLLEDLAPQAELGRLPQGNWDRTVQQIGVLEIRQAGHERPTGFLVAGINPYRRYDLNYGGFMDLLAGQIGAGIASARAYDAERLRAEALAELDRTKTTFFSNVSHEFRTPLTLMLGPLEEAAGTAGLDPRIRDLITVAHRNSLRLLKLVNSLLDFARIEAGRIQAQYAPVDLASLTTDIASSFRSAVEQAGLRYLVDCTPQPEAVYVDRELWEKIVLNLISNAFKFTFHGDINVTLAAAHGGAELRVSDTGTGIPADQLPKLFDRFHRVEGSRGRTHEGSGIGLALVQELVKAHGGKVAVTSEMGAGSTFAVWIPFGNAHLPPDRIAIASATPESAVRADAFLQEALRWLPENGDTTADQAAISDGAPPGNEAGTGPRPRVVLAEDNADMRDYIRRLLSPHMDIQAVTNGQDALNAILDDPPDVVLSDIMMPVMDGLALLAELRQNSLTRTLPVILLSARTGEESRVEGAAAGADDYLMKPFSARELLTRVMAQLRMANLRKEALDAVLRSQADLRAHQEELSRQVAEFDTLFRELPVGVGVARDPGCEYIQINPAFAKLLGMPVELNASKSPRNDGPLPFRVVRDGKDVPVDELPMQLAARLGEEVRGFEFDLIRDDGVRLHEFGHAVPLRDADGNVTGSLGVFLDITERKKAEESLRATNERLSRANEDLNQFAYSASHDLQEPLRNVSIASQLIRKKLGATEDPEIQTFLRFLIEGASRMENLLRDLLSYTRITSSETLAALPTDVNAAVQSVLQALRAAISEADPEIILDQLPPVAVNELHLHQLFQNLIGNSLKYRAPDRRPEIRISARPVGGQWEFCVRDNGIGIDAAFHERIFGIFKRLHGVDKYSGIGIGLAIAQRIVQRYGGAMRVESALDKGAAFYFTLPAGDIV